MLLLLAVGAFWFLRARAPEEGSDLWQSGGLDGLGIGTGEAEDLSSEPLFNEAFALTRAILSGQTPSPAEHSKLQDFEGRRVFLTVYGLAHPPRSTTGKGKTLMESVTQAALALREDGKVSDAKEAVQSGAYRLKVEVAATARRKEMNRAKDDKGKEILLTPDRRSVGLKGFYMEVDGRPTWITPTEVIEQDIYFIREAVKEKGFKPSDIRRKLESRADSEDMPMQVKFMEFTTESWVEGATAQDPKIRLYRGRPDPRYGPTVTPDSLLQASVGAADYLARIIEDDGRQLYLYHTTEHRESTSYNMLRHNGSTFALLQAYARTLWPRYREAAERSLKYTLSQSKEEKKRGPWGEDILFVLDGKDAKLGGAGLALIAFAQHLEASGDRTWLPQMRAYARFIVMMQRENGRMESFYAHEPGMAVDDEENIYYPGEALLGLMRLHALEPNPLWLTTAKKAADYMILERDAAKTEKDIPHDHWLMYGLSYLYHFTHEARYRDHSYKIARAISAKVRGEDHADIANYPDLVGGFGTPPGVTPGACRIEGLAATVDLAREAKEDVNWLLDTAKALAGFNLRMQFTPRNSYFAEHPAQILGGFPESPIAADIRNDYVQHTLSGLLGTERQMRAEAGEVLPGGPSWPERQRSGPPFPGIPEGSVPPLPANVSGGL